jgi:hypothetical protein
MSLSRRTFVAGLLAAPAGLAACTDMLLGENDAPRRIAVLIDRSGSIAIEDRRLYIQSYTTLARQLRSGDRIIAAPVGDAGQAEFRTLIDHSVRTSRKRLERQEIVEDMRRQLEAAAPALLDPAQWGRSRRTRIVETIAAAAQVYAPAPRAGDQLILLSDGVEDSEVINLDRPAGEAAMRAALEAARGRGLLPRLAGLTISVVGAGGQDPAQVERFWRLYAAATGATIGSYGRLPYAGEAEGEGG